MAVCGLQKAIYQELGHLCTGSLPTEYQQNVALLRQL
jgi:hypothetical protein